MSDDWVQKQLKVRERKLQERIDAQKRRQLAEAGASAFFHTIKHRMHGDLESFHKAGAYTSLVLEEGGVESFSVIDRGFARPISLFVNLDLIVVKFTYSFPQKKEGLQYPGTGALCICSDLEGFTQARKPNREDGVFADASEVSEFFLRPLLDYIDHP